MTKKQALKEWQENNYFELRGVFVETQSDAIENWGEDAKNDGIDLTTGKLWRTTDSGTKPESYNSFEEFLEENADWLESQK